MPNSLSFVAVPLLVLAMAGISSDAVAAPQDAIVEQQFRGSGSTPMESVMNVRQRMGEFEEAHSVECVSTFDWVTQWPTSYLWTAYTNANCWPA